MGCLLEQEDPQGEGTTTVSLVSARAFDCYVLVDLKSTTQYNPLAALRIDSINVLFDSSMSAAINILLGKEWSVMNRP